MLFLALLTKIQLVHEVQTFLKKQLSKLCPHFMKAKTDAGAFAKLAGGGGGGKASS